MLLYHYSLKELTDLETVNKQTGVNFISTPEAPAYRDNISLFIEPLPLDIIASVFKDKHPFYKVGTIIYEHVIDSDDLEDNQIWFLAETPKLVRMIENIDWMKLSDVGRLDTIKRLFAIEAKLGYRGTSKKDMLKALTPFIGLTRDFFIASTESISEEKPIVKYAKSVPHLMIYPRLGVVPVKEARKVKIGNTKLPERNYHISFRELPKVLHPRQPEDHDFNARVGEPLDLKEDLKPRVSFSPTVEHCFAAIYPNVSRFFEIEKYPYLQFYVYRSVKPLVAVIPEKIVRAKVYDSGFTREVCSLNPVEVELVAMVRIPNPGDHEVPLYTKPFGDQSKPDIFVVPFVEVTYIDIKKPDTYLKFQKLRNDLIKG